jgi:hypothetical protein
MAGRHLEGKSEAGTFASPCLAARNESSQKCYKGSLAVRIFFKPIAQDAWVLFSLHAVDVKTLKAAAHAGKRKTH